MFKVAGLKGLIQLFALGVIGLSLSACDDVTKWNQADTSASSSSSISSTSSSAPTFSGTVAGNTGTLTLYNNSAYICEIPYLGSSSASSSSGKLCGYSSTTASTNGSFKLNLPVGYAYNVTYVGPQGQLCSVLAPPSTTASTPAAAGTVKTGTFTSDVPGITIICTSSLNLKGTTTGLLPGNSFVLTNNAVTPAQTKTVSSNTITAVAGTVDTFFAATSGNYDLSITTQPTGQDCSFPGGKYNITGSQTTADITSIIISCTTKSYAIGGAATGLATGAKVGLRLNGGTATTTVQKNEAFVLTGSVLHQQSYLVDIVTQPSQQATAPVDQTCSLSQQAGKVNGEDVTTIALTCAANKYTIAGSTSGATVTATGSSVGNTVTVANGIFNLQAVKGDVVALTASGVTGNSCVVSGSPITVGTQDVVANVVCTPNVYKISGSSLNATVTASGSTAGGSVTVADGVYSLNAAYGNVVTLTATKTGNTCSIQGSPITVGAADQTADVSCTVNSYLLSGATDGAVVTAKEGTTPLVNNSTAAGVYSFSATYNKSITLFATKAGYTCTFAGVASPYTLTVGATNVVKDVSCSSNSYTISGLTDGATVTAAGSSISNAVSVTGATYSVLTKSGDTVTLTAVKTGYDCSVAGSPISVVSADVTANVTCTPKTFTISGSDGGATTLTATINGNAATPVITGGTYTLSAKYGDTVVLGATSTAAGEYCAVNGSPITVSSNTTADVVCSTTVRTVGGTVIGLAVGNTLTLINGATELSITANGAFAFINVPDNSRYNIAIKAITGPTTQACTVIAGAGTVLADVTNVYVFCQAAYTVGGTVTGNTAPIVLTNGTETLSLGVDPGAGQSFAFSAQDDGSTYSVTTTSPAGQTCTVTNPSGVIASANVTNVAVTCVATTYQVGGLSGVNGLQVKLTPNVGAAQTYTIGTTGAWNFPTGLVAGTSYTVEIVNQAPGKSCIITAGDTGVIGTANVNNIAFGCSDLSWKVGGTVSGLLDGNTLELKNNGGSAKSITANGPYVYNVNPGETYNISVSASPVGQTCQLVSANGSGTATADVTGIDVICTVNQYTIGGTVSGLTSGSVDLTLNGTETQTINTGATAFTFTTTVAHGSSYTVTKGADPAGLTCLLFNASSPPPVAQDPFTNTITGNVSYVQLACSPTTYTIGGTVSNLTGSVTLVAFAGDTASKVISSNGPFTLTSKRTSGQTYAVAVVAGGQPAGYTCTITGGDVATNNGSGTVGTTNIDSVVVDCGTPATYTLGVALSGVPVGSATAQLASYLTIRAQSTTANLPPTLVPENIDVTRVVVYGSGNPLVGTGNVTFGTPALWATQLPVTNNSLVVNAGNLYLVNYGGGGVQCTVGTTAPTGTTVGLPQVIAATEQPTTPVGTSTTACTTTVNLTYVGPYSGATAATYTPYEFASGQSYTLTITSNPAVTLGTPYATCKIGSPPVGSEPDTRKGVGQDYIGTFTNTNEFVPVNCEYAGATISGTINNYGSPKTVVPTEARTTATWAVCTTAGTCTMTVTSATGIAAGQQVWLDSTPTAADPTLTSQGMGLGSTTVNTYVGSAYVPGNTTVAITSTTSMAATTATGVAFTAPGAVATYYGMRLTVTGTAVDNTPISYTTDATALPINSTTFTIPSTYLFKAGTSYNVTISTAPTYPTGAERNCTLYNGSGVVPSGTDSTPVINNLVIDCGIPVANSRLLLGNSTSVQTTALLAAPAAPGLPGGAQYTAVTFADIKSITALSATNGNYLGYVLNSPTSTAGSLAVLQVAATTGATTAPTATSPAVQTLPLGANPYGVAVSSGVVIATNTTDNNMTVATNTGPGTLTLVGNTTIGTGSSAPRGVAFHPSNGFAYVVATGNNAVYPFTINMGATALADKASATSIATGATPYNIAVDSSGRFAYVTNYGAQTISMYKICQFTSTNCVRGTLTGLGTVDVPSANPLYIAADASSVLVVTAGGDVYHYAINNSTGALTQTSNTVNAGAGVTGITLGNARNVFYVNGPGGVAPYSYSSSGIGAAGTPLTNISNAVGTSIR